MLRIYAWPGCLPVVSTQRDGALKAGAVLEAAAGAAGDQAIPLPIFHGDDAERVAQWFAKVHHLDAAAVAKVAAQIAAALPAVDAAALPFDVQFASKAAVLLRMPIKVSGGGGEGKEKSEDVTATLDIRESAGGARKQVAEFGGLWKISDEGIAQIFASVCKAVKC